MDYLKIIDVANDYLNRMFSFQAGKKWHRQLLIRFILASFCSAIPPTTLIASKSYDLQLKSTAANYLAARQALFFKEKDRLSEPVKTIVNTMENEHVRILQGRPGASQRRPKAENGALV